MPVLEGLEPQEVFTFFEEIAEIPHGTFNTKQISDYCVKFAHDRNFEVIQDEANNVIIKKVGTAGYENSEPIIIQGHLDMVCEKTADSDHDFTRDGIKLFVEEGFLKARGTTLGADNGIAVAYMLALLDSNNIPHPPLEAIFTSDEEVGMVGAGAIDLTPIKGNMLLNIDSDVEGTFVAGCSGGFRQSLILPLKRKKRSGEIVTIEVKGLRGGHSGIEIDQGRGNANKMMARLLNHLKLNTELSLISFNGGNQDNVITSSCRVELLTAEPDNVKVLTDEMKEIWLSEFEGAEPEFKVTIEIKSGTADVMTKKCTNRVIHLLSGVPYGVQAMIRSLKDKVETSVNMGVVVTQEDEMTIIFLIRSSVASKMSELEDVLTMWARQTGANSIVSNQYPAWAFRPESKLRSLATEVYQELFSKEPVISTLHAGLECGLLSGKKPSLDCISFGPDAYDAHSVYERLDLASTKRTWEFIKTLLAKCK